MATKLEELAEFLTEGLQVFRPGVSKFLKALNSNSPKMISDSDSIALKELAHCRERDEKKRVDLRHLDICSVDPPGCTDIDDALHCRDLANGNYEVSKELPNKLNREFFDIMGMSGN
ncbi:unnamed protein product [Timema podura]|uniref:RNB domain-containing protein n=1 Tax=Timema podura TaxID=61482 RepID=A0ABN7NS03_TIMPD|nr:unnamed protein product [Timema podura]